MIWDHVLGIDPGAIAGGAVLVDATGSVAIGAWSWRRVQRAKRYAYALRDSDRPAVTLRTLHECGRHIADRVQGLTASPWLLCEEALFLKPGAGGLTLEVLADARAEVCGPLRGIARAWADPARVLAVRWRRDILSIPPRTRAAEAARWALRGVPALVGGLGDLQAIEHVCEAAAIARWGARCWKGDT
jgi:hypothetical protein